MNGDPFVVLAGLRMRSAGAHRDHPARVQLRRILDEHDAEAADALLLVHRIASRPPDQPESWTTADRRDARAIVHIIEGRNQ